MLGFLKKAATQVVNTSVKYAVSSGSLNNTIKTYIQNNLEENFKELIPHIHAVLEMPHVKQNKELSQLLKDALNNINKLKNTLKQDDTLDPIVGIIQNHVHDYETIDQFKDKLLHSKTLEGLKLLIQDLIDIQKYEKLIQDVQDAYQFDTLSSKRKTELKKIFSDQTVITDLANDNKIFTKLFITDHALVSCEKIAGELNLNINEKIKLIGTFNQVIENHFKDFEGLRKNLMKILPNIFEQEKRRILGITSTSDDSHTSKRPSILNCFGKSKTKPKKRSADQDSYVEPKNTKKQKKKWPA